MPQKYVFINYRRKDAQQAVRALRLALEMRLVEGSVFVDVDDIQSGDLWADRLKQKLDDAAVMLSVVGPGWLSAKNEYHQRRLDLEDDWVRQEIAFALGTDPPKLIIPVLVDGEVKLPPELALPVEIRGLLKSQAHVLRDESAWSRDFEALLKVLTDTHGLELKPLPTGTGVALPPPPSNAIVAYLRRLETETEHLTLMGMGRSFQVELPIAQAYVPLRTTLVRSFELKETERFHAGLADHEENVDLCEVFRTAASMQQRGIVLLGEPGSGKTTGARQLAWHLSSGHCRPEELGLPAGITPVLLRFRNLSKEILAQCVGGDQVSRANGLRLFLEHETQCVDAADGEQHPGPELWNLKDPGLLWILDGLDEVIDPAWRQMVSGWIQRAIGNRPKDWFLVTSRFQGYYREGVSLGAKFVEFHVRPLSDAQVERFVRDWFGAAFGKLLGEGTKAQGKAQADSQELLDILARPSYQTGRIRELCTNPLLLTILCIVFHEERKLPTKRAELYAHCVRVLLEYWRRDLYKDDMQTGLQPYDAAAAQTVLARLAWWMHLEQDRTAAPLDDLAAEAAKGLARVSADSGLGRDGQAFLKRMRDEAGILAMTGDGAGNCGFLHLSFQEYLGADRVGGRTGEAGTGELVARVGAVVAAAVASIL
ncbi:MAG: TIR domain-containing protein [Planctomycetota bacterium]|nr:TIR domain-containing protein [Planctomycetota bacterium]